MRTLLYPLLTVYSLGALLLAAPLPAKASASFTVRDIAIEATGQNATEARAKALQSGQEQAFRQLLRQLAPSAPESVVALPHEKIAALVQQIELRDERISASRYSAFMDVTFNPQTLRAVLERANLPYTEPVAAPESAPALVLPLLVKEGKALLLGEENPWRDAWNGLNLSRGPVRLLLPMGDLEDMTLATPERVLSADYAALQPLAAKYRTSHLLVAEARCGDVAATGEGMLDIRLRRLSQEGMQETSIQHKGKAGQSLSSLLQDAAKDIVARLNRQWKLQARQAAAAVKEMEIYIPFSGLQEWLAIKLRLQSANELGRIDIRVLSANHAMISLYSSHAEEELAAKFGQYGLHFSVEDGQATLRLAQ